METKIIIRSWQTELEPTKSQIFQLQRFCDAYRHVFNWGLERKQKAYENKEKLTRYDLQKQYTAIQNELLPFAPDFPRASMEFALIDIDSAYANFFRRLKEGKKGKELGFPKFKSRYKSEPRVRFRGWKAESNQVKITNIGWIKLKENNYIPISNVEPIFTTIRCRAGRWYVSCTAKIGIPVLHPVGEPIGIDRGIKSLAVCSDGTIYENPKAYASYERKLKKLHRELHRRKLRSNNRAKTKNKIAQLCKKMADLRQVTIHRMTHDICVNKESSIIAIEDLNVKGMLANHKLAKSIADVAFGEIHRQFAYKSDWYGNELYIADRWFASSKTCSNCGNIIEVLTLSQRTYKCPVCNFQIDRDLNAGINLKKDALKSRESINACGEDKVHTP